MEDFALYRRMMSPSSIWKAWFLLCLLHLLRCTYGHVPGYDAFLRLSDSERAAASVQVEAAQGVLARLLPAHVKSFEFHIISKVNHACGRN